jgi:hypothetical protein
MGIGARMYTTIRASPMTGAGIARGRNVSALITLVSGDGRRTDSHAINVAKNIVAKAELIDTIAVFTSMSVIPRPLNRS